jgi:hypothetical protein
MPLRIKINNGALASHVADPDPHSVCLLDQEPASKCGSGSGCLKICAKSRIYFVQRSYIKYISEWSLILSFQNYLLFRQNSLFFCTRISSLKAKFLHLKQYFIICIIWKYFFRCILNLLKSCILRKIALILANCLKYFMLYIANFF